MPEVVEGLRRLGHDVKGGVGGFDRTLFGRGHVIRNVDRVVGDVAEAGPTDGVGGSGSRFTPGDSERFYLIGCETRSDGIPCGY